MKVGRNAPCPCGSGKKYKKCCMNRTQPPVDLFQRRLGDAYERLMKQLTRFAEKSFGDVALLMAAAEFLFWSEEDGEILEQLEEHMPFFMPWFMFNWTYEPENWPDLASDEMDLEIRIPPHQTIAGIYARDHGKRLDALQRRLLEALGERPHSFLEVVACNPGQGFRLRDVLSGEVYDVIEKMGSRDARPGDLLMGRVVQVDHVAMLTDLGPILIPPRFKPMLVEFRKALAEKVGVITPAVLREAGPGLRGLYFDIFEELSTPPGLQNTDGDPLVFHTLHYEIEDPREAFDKLVGLAVTEDADALRAQATLDRNGRIVRAEIPWSKPGNEMHKSWDNTLLGRVVIDGRRLTAEVNSEARAKTIRREIEKRLGTAARYRTTTVESPEAMMERSAAADGDDDEFPSQEELMQVPEVRRQIEKMLRDHWEGWVDEPVPALDGRTPRQAVKTADGREKVEALLLEARRNMEGNAVMRAVGSELIDDVRRRLGLGAEPARDGQAARQSPDRQDLRVAKIESLITGFGRARLDEQHTGLALALCDHISGMDALNLRRGRVEIWAAAIVYVIARLNFLFDRNSDPFITRDDICTHFGTRKATTANKAAAIEKACGLGLGNPDFCRPEIAGMFRFYETPEGFIVPESFFDEPEAQDVAPAEKTESGGPSAATGTRPKKRRAKRPERKEPKEEDAGERADDDPSRPRQLKLFDDH